MPLPTPVRSAAHHSHLNRREQSRLLDLIGSLMDVDSAPEFEVWTIA